MCRHSWPVPPVFTHCRYQARHLIIAQRRSPHPLTADPPPPPSPPSGLLLSIDVQRLLYDSCVAARASGFRMTNEAGLFVTYQIMMKVCHLCFWDGVLSLAACKEEGFSPLACA